MDMAHFPSRLLLSSARPEYLCHRVLLCERNDRYNEDGKEWITKKTKKKPGNKKSSNKKYNISDIYIYIRRRAYGQWASCSISVRNRVYGSVSGCEFVPLARESDLCPDHGPVVINALRIRNDILFMPIVSDDYFFFSFLTAYQEHRMSEKLTLRISIIYFFDSFLSNKYFILFLAH